MSVRRGLLAFGISATAALGGAAAIHESFNQENRETEAKACATEQYAPKPQCEAIIAPAEVAKNANSAQQVYGWIGGILLLGGALGVAGAYSVVTEGESESTRRQQPRRADSSGGDIV